MSLVNNKNTLISDVLQLSDAIIRIKSSRGYSFMTSRLKQGSNQGFVKKSIQK
jgi:hypothetical protein